MLTVPGHTLHKGELAVDVFQALIHKVGIRHEKVLEERFHLVIDSKRDLHNDIIPNIHELLEQISELIQEELPDLSSPGKEAFPVISAEINKLLDLVDEGLPEVSCPIQKLFEFPDHGILQTGDLIKEIPPEPGNQVIGCLERCNEIITQRNYFV